MTDAAVEVLDVLSRHGLRARVVHGSLKVGPRDRLNGELRALIRAHRAELYAALCPPRPRGLSGLRRAHLIECPNGPRFWLITSRGCPPAQVARIAARQFGPGARLINPEDSQ